MSTRELSTTDDYSTIMNIRTSSESGLILSVQSNQFVQAKMQFVQSKMRNCAVQKHDIWLVDSQENR